MDGLVDKDLIDRDILRPLKSEGFEGDISRALNCVYIEKDDLNEVLSQVVGGMVAVFYSGNKKAYLIEFRKWSERSVEQPTAEQVVRGPKEGFTENIRTNTALIRRKIKNPNLIIENFVLGRQTNTPIELVYVYGIVNKEILAEVKKRLSKIDVDSIMESGYIEQYITENKLSPVSGIGLTQKPDVAAARILEGRVGILCDGTPHVLTIPELFMENIKTNEDYNNKAIYATVSRSIRLLGLFITVVMPGLSVAILTYHVEMVPAIFLSSVIKSMLKTPMSLSAEVLLLIILFELLKEAGKRLPEQIGSAISIVGSLIIGDMAVNAGLVSATAVIIVATAAVTNFIVPNLEEFTIIYRLSFWLLGSIMGLLGIAAGLMIIMTHLVSTKSFGVPILSSFSKHERKDSIVRFLLEQQGYRPASIAKDNVKRKEM